eukprot:TRINITY_DN2587_c0_g1_i1.p1 TRINITY_DN2587_c0_g1~~TRINITY_DN2587_c0_g1_i1.p1  ORF type:complete len:348 (-),score=43.34 TRINITY_DN2587_c0_g1_i1:91-1134(-)
MGIACATRMDERTEDIDKGIKKQRRGMIKEKKLLLLGSGDAGKSTFCKQMKIIHQPGGLSDEYPRYKSILRHNCLSSTVSLFRLCEAMDVKIPYDLLSFKEEFFEATELTAELATISEQIWAQEVIKEAFKNRTKASHIQILSASPYYLENASRFAEPDFLPNDKDVTLAKLRTTGIIETHFEVAGISFVIIDVGGQRNEQRKWIHCFEGVSAVIYLIALDEFDMTLEEDNTTNRFEASLKLFSAVTGSQWFSSNLCLLFLNKRDLFEEKIKLFPLNNYFPDVPKGAEVEECMDYMKKRYEEAFRGTALQVFTTCAVDTGNCKRVFESIKEAVLMRAVEVSGINVNI